MTRAEQILNMVYEDSSYWKEKTAQYKADTARMNKLAATTRAANFGMSGHATRLMNDAERMDRKRAVKKFKDARR